MEEIRVDLRRTGLAYENEKNRAWLEYLHNTEKTSHMFP